MRRRSYEEWLALPESLLAVARVDEVAIGYAVVRIEAPGSDEEASIAEA